MNKTKPDGVFKLKSILATLAYDTVNYRNRGLSELSKEAERHKSIIEQGTKGLTCTEIEAYLRDYHNNLYASLSGLNETEKTVALKIITYIRDYIKLD